MNTDQISPEGASTPTPASVEGAAGAKIRLYATAFCPYCMAAKRILKDHGFEWEEIRVDSDPSARQEMTERTGGATKTPRIFINGRYLGGLDELMMVEHLNEWPKYMGTPDARMRYMSGHID